MKIMEKVRCFLFGEKLMSDKAQEILKEKNLTDNEKFNKILSFYGKYYVDEHYDVAFRGALEYYYEEIVKNNKTNKERLAYFVTHNSNEITFCNIQCLLNMFNKLNINVEELSKEAKNIYDLLNSFNEEKLFQNYRKCLIKYDNVASNNLYQRIDEKNNSIVKQIEIKYKKDNNNYDEIDELFGF